MEEVIKTLERFKTQILELTEFNRTNANKLKIIQVNIGILLEKQRDSEDYGLLSKLFMGAMENKRLLKAAMSKNDHRIYQSCVHHMLSQIDETTDILNAP
jgi:hypothetical protein